MSDLESQKAENGKVVQDLKKSQVSEDQTGLFLKLPG